MNKTEPDAYDIDVNALSPKLREYMAKKKLAPPGPFNPKLNNGFKVFKKCKLTIEKPIKFQYKQ